MGVCDSDPKIRKRITRVLVYEGRQDWLLRTMEHNAVSLVRPFVAPGVGTIKEVMVKEENIDDEEIE